MGLAALDAALGNRERVLIDSSTLIAFHDRLERAHPVAQHLLLRIADAQDPLHGYYSAISASELLVRPIRTNVPSFTAMHAFVTTFPHLTILPVDLFVAMQ